MNPSYTHSQVLLSQWIRDLGFSNTLEKPFPPYSADIFIGELNLIIEIDSKYHLSKKKDKKRDEYLYTNYQVNVMRFNFKDICVSKKDIILNYIKNYCNRKVKNESD